MSEHITKANSMALADRLALRIKDSDVGVFLTEDELIELGREAINKAFFSPQRKPTGNNYGASHFDGDPLIVELARNTFKPLMEQRVTEIVTAIAETPEFQLAIKEVAIATIPDLLLNYGRRLATESAAAISKGSINAVLDRIRSGQLEPNSGGFGPSDYSAVTEVATQRVGAEGKDLPST